MPDRARAEHDETGLLSPVRRRYEPHGPGLLYLLITFFLAVGSINSQNNLLFFAFGLAISGFLISGLVSGPPLMRVAARRVSPGPARVGESASIRYVIASRGGLFSAMGLEIRELTDVRGGTPGGGSLTPAGVLCLRPGARLTATSALTPTRRGRHELAGFTVSTTYPFGLLRKTLVFEQRHNWVITPRRVALRDMPWHRAGREGATLSAVTARRGTSTEFYALRAYVPGDPPRQIAWLPSARVGELVVKEQAASAPPKIWIRVDEPDHDTPDHLVERGAALVAALAQDATQAGFAVGLTGRGVGSIRPFSGPRQVRAIQTAMATLGSGPFRVEEDEPPATPDRRTLRVHVHYEFSGRTGGSTEFKLCAADLARWHAGAEIPPEFEPAAERDTARHWTYRIGRAVGVPAFRPAEEAAT